ncbi:hypothetical protein [Sulfurisphaera ohwakuensis]|uniref:Heme A synthase n=2 Tax=Sulfurisphaera ohwakuensis TaxID=69656 RepID=A0A7J9RYH0_SULOH|nr:hypothetical protein [Sulfurisphaera ohwakuensis]MBB5255302.1 heme A synthase [Sulfurisphaera ohwakuensis]
MKHSQLWLMGAGVAILQMLIGNVMVFYGILPQLLGLHALLAAILLVIAVYGYVRVKVALEKRILMGNIGLVIIASIFGYLFIDFGNPVLILIHFILALGILSNFSVLYGIERGQLHH